MMNTPLLGLRELVHHGTISLFTADSVQAVMGIHMSQTMMAVFLAIQGSGGDDLACRPSPRGRKLSGFALVSGEGWR